MYIVAGERSFMLKYPRLYLISNQREAKVGEVRVVVEAGREWRFRWRRHLFVWEEELLVSLMEDLEGMMWSNQEDVWRWNLEESGIFTVKSTYDYLLSLLGSVDLWNGEERVFHRLWKSPAPSKIVAFAWKVLLNRVPTKANFALRDVLNLNDLYFKLYFCWKNNEPLLFRFMTIYIYYVTCEFVINFLPKLYKISGSATE